MSYTGGGYKRLFEYAKWFHAHGGAWFVIHPKAKAIAAEFTNNRFFCPAQPQYQRTFDDCGYLRGIVEEIGKPDLYFAFGIPMYSRVGCVNWFHVTNVVPLDRKGIPLTLFDRVKFAHLGYRIRRNYHNADIISTESEFSFSLIDRDQSDKLFLSVLGADDQLAFRAGRPIPPKENIATVLGTISYKTPTESHEVFKMLRQDNPGLQMMILGDPRLVPQRLRRQPDVVIAGSVSRKEVIKCLQRTKYYISTTRIENAYNAASEGIHFADESYISDIPPHRELLANEPFEKTTVRNVDLPLLHVKRDSLSTANLKTWNSVVMEMIQRFERTLARSRA